MTECTIPMIGRLALAFLGSSAMLTLPLAIGLWLDWRRRRRELVGW